MIVAAVLLQNLIYIIGAMTAIVIGGLAVTLRHHRPTSIEANMALFNKGLRALAPAPGSVRVPSPTVSPLARTPAAIPDPADLTPPGTPTEAEAG